MRLRADWFEAARLASVPEAWRGRVAGRYARKLEKIQHIQAGTGKRTKAEQAANAWLADVAGIFAKVRFAPGLTEGDIRDTADKCAAQAINLAEIVPGVFVAGIEALRARLASFADSYGVTAPGPKIKDRPAVARMTCPIWWRRALRIAQARQLERGAITLGYVHKRGEIYASDATVARRMEQRRRNAAMLEATTARNLDMGDEYNLAELAAVSVANPAIRRGELMTRIAGFELVAKGMGHLAEFVTLTCPSRFHRMRQAENGRMVHNAKHDGSSPRDAQKHLVRLWACIRAKLGRMGLKVYGFRIAEPHHDACPHWHILLFIPPYLGPERRALPRFRAIIRRYALRSDGSETGAKKYRVRFDAIDLARGSAAGYVLKYVSKNIDGNGYELQGDIEGRQDAIYPGQRVEAWASTWGIRQFQQIGGPPVGVWRELRRMKAADEYPEHLNAAIAAADCGKNSEAGKTAEHWGRFIEVMGGPVVARSALPLRVAYTAPGERINTHTGEIKTGAETLYGDEAPGVVYGVRWMELETRRVGIAVYSEWVEKVAASVRYSWEIVRGFDVEEKRGLGGGFFVGADSGDLRRGGAGAVVGGGLNGAEGLGGNHGSIRFYVAEGFRVRTLGGISGVHGGAGRRCREVHGHDGGSGGELGLGFGAGEACPTRTRVNNCTRQAFDGQFCLVDFKWLRQKEGGEDGKEGESGGGNDAGRIESSADTYRREKSTVGADFGGRVVGA